MKLTECEERRKILWRVDIKILLALLYFSNIKLNMICCWNFSCKTTNNRKRRNIGKKDEEWQRKERGKLGKISNGNEGNSENKMDTGRRNEMKARSKRKKKVKGKFVICIKLFTLYVHFISFQRLHKSSSLIYKLLKSQQNIVFIQILFLRFVWSLSDRNSVGTDTILVHPV